MDFTTKEFKETAKGFGADLVGIASADSLDYLPAEENPRSIFPQAKNVIVIARRILRGSLRGIEEGTHLDSFAEYGMYHLEDNFIAKTTYDITLWMEARGYEAVPLFAYDCAGQQVGVPVKPGKPAPNVMLKYRILAQAAGLGETALNGLFLTPEFGPRQRFQFMLTDAELEADKPFAPHICNDCGACVNACPLHALNAANAEKFGFKGCERNVAARDNKLCQACKNGAVQTNEGRFNVVDRIGAACGRACIAALDNAGEFGGKFTNAFRTHETWKRNLLGDKE